MKTDAIRRTARTQREIVTEMIDVAKHRHYSVARDLYLKTSSVNITFLFASA